MAKLIDDLTIGVLDRYQDKGLAWSFEQLDRLLRVYTLEQLRRDMPRALLNWQAMFVQEFLNTPAGMFPGGEIGADEVADALAPWAHTVGLYGGPNHLGRVRWDELYDELGALGRIR